jgi:4-hydroxy-3-polyprenylbenzoate decarboxylase
VIDNTPIDYLDFTPSVSGLGSKIGLNATERFPGKTNRKWGCQIRMNQAVIDRVDAVWGTFCLLGSGRKIWR